jgi:signal transduction histidine kinase/ligand-binding sensor domain-containing protein
MWFGTNDGLNRYDGKSLVYLKGLEKEEVRLVRGKITSLAEGGSNKLYIASYGVGLLVYDLLTDKLKSFTHLADDDASLLSNSINDIISANDTTVYIATDAGVSRFNTVKETFENIPLNFENNDDPYREGINVLFADSNGQLWIGTKGQGIMRFVEDEKRFVPFVNKSGDDKGWEKNFINSIAGYKDGLFLVTTKNGLYLFEPQTGLFFEHLIADTELTGIAADNDGSYWIGSRINGLYHITADNKVYQFQSNSYDPESFPDDQVISVYRDKMQNLWVGTRTKGVVQAVVDRKPFFNIYYVPDKPSISDNSVFAINEDAGGNVWIGSVKGLTVWDRKNNSFTPVAIKIAGKRTTNYSCWSLYFDNENVVWIGTDRGLIKYNIKKGSFFHYYMKSHDAHSLVYNDVVAIEKDKNGDIWVSTPNGVGRLNKRTNRFTNYVAVDTIENTLSHNRVWDILSDSKGRLWFGTENGLSLYNFETDDFTTIKFSNAQFDSSDALANSIMSVLEADDGYLWVATQNGVYIYDPDKKEVVNFVKVYNDISKRFVYNVLEADDSFWASTNKSIIKIDKNTYEIKAEFLPDDGFLNDEFNAGAAKKLSDGTLLFGGIAGVTGFYPEKIHLSSFCPPVYLTGISLFGEDVNPDNPEVFKRATFVRNTMSASTIIITHDEKMLTLKFSALDYTKPQRIKYFYRIMPVSEKWISLGSRSFVSFINLKPGNYVLEMRSTNSDGIMCDNIKKLGLEVTPPVWERWWWITLEVLIVLLLLFLIIRYRLLHLKREKDKLEEIVMMRTREIQEQRNIANRQRDEIARQKEELQDFAAELEDKVRERTKELEDAKLKAEESDRLKSAFLSNMSHEIRTPMNAIMGFSELLLSNEFDEKERKTFARLVKTNGDSLLKLLNDIIDISMIESGLMKFNFAEVDICSLIDDIFIMIKNSRLFKEKENVRLEIVSKIKEKVFVNTDEDRLRQVITNLLNNALKFTGKGCVELGCEVVDDYIQFYVKDTGIGITEELMGRIFDRFYKIEKTKNVIYGGNGLGLTITKNIVDALDGEIWVESEEGKGTTFWFTIPK